MMRKDVTQGKKVFVVYKNEPPPVATVKAFRERFKAFHVETCKVDSTKRFSSPKSKNMVVVVGDNDDIEQFLRKASGKAVFLPASKTSRSATAKTIMTLKNDFSVSYETLAQILRVAQKSVLRWVQGESHPLPSHQEAIDRTVAIRDQMIKVLRRDAIPRYLTARNEMLGGMRPLDLLISGQAEKVSADIESLKSGAFV